VRVEAWNGTYASEVAAWHYEPPYDFYDLASDPHDAAEMHDPAHVAHYRAILAERYERHNAFWNYDPQRDVVEDGIAVRPELTGRGLGESFLRAQLDYATDRWSPATFCLFVAAWNERAIRLYERLGFSEVGRETRRFELVGEHEFIRMERTA
jgi:RimJ/RimL family protein N-acetyltransferase